MCLWKFIELKDSAIYFGTNSFCSVDKKKGGDFFLLNVKLNRVLINKSLNPLYFSDPLTNSSSAMGLSSISIKLGILLMNSYDF